MNYRIKEFSRINLKLDWKLISYVLICLTPLFFVNQVSDLPIWIGNGEQKAREILNLQLPSDNFYPVGKALMLLPFLWLSPNFFPVIILYFAASSVIYFLICQDIQLFWPRLIALAALPANPYLIWLCYSSQDTIFELFLLLALVYSALKNRFYLFIFSGFLLCLTRPAYWVIFIGLALFLLILEKKAKLKNRKKYFLVFLLVPINMFFNLYAYGSMTFAEESGVTSYYSYNKYLYLSLPKFDMDVFLSTKGHVGDFGVHTSSEYTEMAIQSIKDNPKEVLLATMQKLESYIFAVQKVPQLPGEYYLSEDANSIVIGNERLTWSLILGNLAYEIYRSLLLVGFLMSIGFVVILRKIERRIWSFSSNALILIMPWILGIIPGLLFYTETRFKIVSEVLIAPFIGVILSEKRANLLLGNEHPPASGKITL